MESRYKSRKRHWDGLMPEILGLIFRRLELEEKLTVVPCVCKPWAKAIEMPDCWQEIDIERWSLYRCPDKMLLLLTGRSSGSLRKLSVYGLKTQLGLSLIGDYASSLWELGLPGSKISDYMLEQLAVDGKLSGLTSLNLSYCPNIEASGIEAVGKHCKKLTHFKLNMRPPKRKWYVEYIRPEESQDDEALVIASTMPQLKHLELAYQVVRTQGVLKILTNCLELELLNIRGCRNVKLDDELLKNRPQLNVLKDSHVSSCCLEGLFFDDMVGYPPEEEEEEEEEEEDGDDKWLNGSRVRSISSSGLFFYDMVCEADDDNDDEDDDDSDYYIDDAN